MTATVLWDTIKRYCLGVELLKGQTGGSEENSVFSLLAGVLEFQRDKCVAKDKNDDKNDTNGAQAHDI